MTWKYKESTFTYNGKLVTRRIAKFDCLLGHFEAHEAINGTPFVIYPGMFGLEEWFGPPMIGPPKKKVKSYEDGILECEEALSKLKKEVAEL